MNLTSPWLADDLDISARQTTGLSAMMTTYIGLAVIAAFTVAMVWPWPVQDEPYWGIA